MVEDMARCGRCHREMPARLLDAVLLDPDGNDASDEGYCLMCFPFARKIVGDIWRPLYDDPT